jgi:serine protease
MPSRKIARRSKLLVVACATALTTGVAGLAISATAAQTQQSRPAAVPAGPVKKVAAKASAGSSERGARINTSGLGTRGNERVNGFIVRYRDGVTTTAKLSGRRAQLERAGRSAFSAKYQTSVQRVRTLGTGSDLIRTGRRLSPAEAETLMRTIAADPNVASIEIDQWGQVAQNYAPYNTGDTYFTYQWALVDPTAGNEGAANIGRAWNQGTFGGGVRVAIVDSGLTNHPELAGKVANGYDFISDINAAGDNNGRDAIATDEGDGYNAGGCGPGTPARDSTWHGTQMATIIAANTWNSSGIAGAAPGATIVNARAMGRCGGLKSDVIDAITWASGGNVPGVPTNWTPAQVINLSLQFDGACPSDVGAAISNAINRGSTVVAAAGNSNTNTANVWPASCRPWGAITVAAVNQNGQPTDFTNAGADVAITAPGVNIVSGINAGTRGPTNSYTYAFKNGTSHAAALTSAVIALVQSRRNPDVSGWDMPWLVRFNSRRYDSGNTLGWGYLDADLAVRTNYPN